MSVQLRKEQQFLTEPARLSDAIRIVRLRVEDTPLSLHDLIAIFGSRGHGFLVLFLTLPFLQPIPLVGLSTPIGFAIAFIGVLVALSRPPWLPRRLRAVKIPQHILLKICAALEIILQRTERLILPRWKWLFQLRWFRTTTGILIAINGALLALPLPVPFSNFFPALVLLLLALGSLEEDSLLIALGYLAAFCALAFFVSIALLPYLGIQYFRVFSA